MTRPNLIPKRSMDATSAAATRSSERSPRASRTPYRSDFAGTLVAPLIVPALAGRRPRVEAGEDWRIAG
jgi:hypothetical protein